MCGEGQGAEIATEMGEAAQAVWEQGTAFKERFDEALTQDFNTPKAISHLFELARAINRFAEGKNALKRGGPVVAPAREAFAYAAEHLGVLSMETEEFHTEVKAKHIVALGLTQADILALITERATLREARQWGEADRIRQELAQCQISLMDHRSGTTWRIMAAKDRQHV
jgi:cysteinyl-tRNA synthetase